METLDRKEVPSESCRLNTSRVRLRIWRDGDEKHLYRWHTDLDHLHLWSQDREILPYDRFVQRFLRRMKNRMDLFFIIEQVPASKPVGFVFNYGSDSVDRNAYFCIFVDPEAQGQGIGLDASMLFLKYLFMQFGYRKVYAEVYGFNDHALRILKRSEFKQEGCLTEHRWWNGRFWNQYIFSLNASDFDKTLKQYGRK